MNQKDSKGPRFLAWQAVRGFSKPLVAAVEGWCLGAAMELLMCCDIAIASSEAHFGQPETNLGIMPGAGGTATLTRLVGRARAMHMVLLGEPVGAAAALDYGLIAEVTDAGNALGRALEVAATIAGRPPLALCEAKASIRDGLPADRARPFRGRTQPLCRPTWEQRQSRGYRGLSREASAHLDRKIVFHCAPVTPAQPG